MVHRIPTTAEELNRIEDARTARMLVDDQGFEEDHYIHFMLFDDDDNLIGLVGRTIVKITREGQNIEPGCCIVVVQ